MINKRDVKYLRLCYNKSALLLSQFGNLDWPVASVDASNKRYRISKLGSFVSGLSNCEWE